MDIIGIIRLVISRLPFIAVIAVAVGIIVGVAVFFSPRQYRSETRVATGFTVDNKFSLQEEGLNQFKTDLKFNNLVELIKSPIILNTLSYKLLLHDMDRANDPFGKKPDERDLILTEVLTISEEAVKVMLEGKIENFELLSSYNDVEKQVIDLIWKFGYSPSAIRENLKAKRINFTDYLSIEYTSHNPYLSAYVLNTLTQDFLRYNGKLQDDQTDQSVSFLDSLARVKREVLVTKRNALKNFKTQNNFLNYDMESASKVSQIEEAERERETILSNLRKINLSIESLERRASFSANDEREVGALRESLTSLYERRRNGQGDYETLSDSIQLVRARLDDFVTVNATDPELIEEKDDLLIELQVEEAKLNATNLRLGNLKGQVSSFARTEASIASMQSEVDLAEEEYLKIQETLNNAKNATANTTEEIRVIVRAQPAIKAQSSGLIIKVIIAIVGVSMFCIVILVGGEILDPRIKNSSRFVKMVDIDLIGSLITDQSKSSNSIFIPKVLRAKNELSMRESIRRIRFKINSNSGKVLLFTSLGQNDGKSFVLFEIAKSLSQESKKILIIDTNFRKSSFISLVKDEDKQSTDLAKTSDSPVLVDKVFPDFQDLLIIPDKYPNVHILPNRRPNGSPSEILEKNTFQRLIDKFLNKEGYDYIFLEAQGINECSDALELSVYSDDVIFVFNTNKEVTLEDKSNLEIRNNLNGKVMGAILNDREVPTKKKKA